MWHASLVFTLFHSAFFKMDHINKCLCLIDTWQNCLKTHSIANLAGEQVYAYKNVTFIMNTLAICSPVSLYLMVNKKTVDWSCCVVCLR